MLPTEPISINVPIRFVGTDESDFWMMESRRGQTCSLITWDCLVLRKVWKSFLQGRVEGWQKCEYTILPCFN